ncbi:BnaC01g32840D [Brassica napus]|uniref:BnaC01g32840D protein n=1 Tax=Brassica napus TaxID=3708 RepID=A0A078H6E4_BRANA|nr:BnaC01g32840D [Brassica napus]
MMDPDIQISSGSSSSSSSSNCSGSGSDDELIGKETSGILSAIIFLSILGSSSFTSSAGNTQDSGGCTNHASPSGNGVRILPPPSMTHGTSASPLHDPSDPVDMTGNGIGDDKNSERLIYQDALRNLNQPRTEVDLPPGTLSGNIICFIKIALAWMLQKETSCLHCSGGILADDQGLGKTVSMIALILKQKYESQLKPEITSKQESEILDLDADDDESENAKHDENMENAKDEEARELNSKKRPAAGTLVVCPESVVTQWARELDEKVSDESKLSVLVYHGGNRTKDPSVLAKYDVVITTYAIVTNEVPKQFLLDEDENDESHSFSNSKKRKVSVSASKNRGSFGGTLSRVGWLRVVLDKAQTIKNHRTQVARACCILRAKRRWCLSGAPIQNTVDDLYSYFSRNEKHGYKKLQAVLKAVMLRHTKGTLLDGQPLINLPPKKVNLNKVDFSVEELSFYKKLEAESRFFFQPMLLQEHPYGKESVEAVQRLPKEARINLLNRLESSSAICNICNDPPEHLLLRCVAMYFAIKTALPMISAIVLLRRLNHFFQKSEFTSSKIKAVLDILSRSLNGIEFRRLDGTMSLAARDRAVKEFSNDPDIEVMLMSLKAGNLGLNMVAASHVILLDLWWNPSAEDQAIDRAHRIGQTRPVSVTRVTIKDTVEDRMLFLQEEKRRMVASAYGEDHGGSSATRLTVDDLKFPIFPILKPNQKILLKLIKLETTKILLFSASSPLTTKKISIDDEKEEIAGDSSSNFFVLFVFSNGAFNDLVLVYSCVLLVETELKGWQKTLHKIFVGIEANPMMFTKKLMFLRGQVDPLVFIKKLFRAKIYAVLYRIDYGHEENPQGIRKPNSHFLRFRFKIDMSEGSWYKKIIGALKTIQGVPFTIDAPRQKPPPKKVEAQISDGTETQPKKDTAPPPPEISTSTKHQAKNKKPRGFKKNLLSMSHVVMRT